MSTFSSSSVNNIADMMNVPGVSVSARVEIASAVETNIRSLIKNAVMLMKRSYRERLTADDINASLRKNNVKPLYGHRVPKKWHVCYHEDERLYYHEDEVVRLQDVIQQPLPRCPIEPTFSVHWLAIKGVQPTIPQNPSKIRLDKIQSEQENKALLKAKNSKQRQEGEREVKALAEHVLSKEQQLYFDKVTAAVQGSDPVLKEISLRSVRNDEGLHQLVPYFTKFIADEVAANARNLPALHSLMQLTACLLTSQHLHIDPYLHQLMPSILTCVVGKRLCAHPSEDHWSLREYSCQLIALVCRKYGHAYANLQPRITKTLIRALLNPQCPLTTHYGAIVGLSSFGRHVVATLILPNVAVYLKLLQPVLQHEQNTMKRLEAIHCYNALRDASGMFMRQELQDIVPVAQPERQNGAVSEHEDEDNVTDKDGDTLMTSKKRVKLNNNKPSKVANMKFVMPMPDFNPEVFDIFGEGLYPFVQSTSVLRSMQPTVSLADIFI